MTIIDTLLGHPSVESVNMISNEGDIYLAELIYADKTRKIARDHEGHPRRFRSISELKEELESTGAGAFNLVFHSPYEELGDSQSPTSH